MTGFGSRTGEIGAFAWTADIRSVNGRGLDLKLRMPDWIDGLEAKIRTRLGQALVRGNVTLNLRVTNIADASGHIGLNYDNLNNVLSSLVDVEQKAMDLGISLAPATATDILSLKGVLEQIDQHSIFDLEMQGALITELDQMIHEYCASRDAEGRALEGILRDQITEMTALVAQARAILPDRDQKVKEAVKQQVVRIFETPSDLDETRLAQELAMLAIKSDISEELDRLDAHVASALSLLDEGGAIGRRFDFLTQEFNREANTLCSKSQHSGLTTVGLAMKATIDQMREQVQNVE